VAAEQQVGAVVLTNGDPGWLIRGHFRRKLQEVLFDGRPEADADLAANAKSFFAQIAADRKTLRSAGECAGGRQARRALQERSARRPCRAALGPKTLFDFGEWRSEVASRRNPDGTTSFITISPASAGFEFVVGGGAKQTLTLRDAQHEYLFESG
jgi:hypothetical protein